MAPILKLLLFAVILSVLGIASWWSYKWLNKKIIDSNTLLSVVGYAVLLVCINILLLFGGIYLLIRSYDFFLNTN